MFNLEVDDMSDRRHVNLRELLTLAVLLLNFGGFGGIVWGAAVVSKSVNDLKDATADLKVTTKGMATDITQIKIDYLTRMNVLETRVTANERVISELRAKVR